jgi:hypothetical protein
MSLRYVLGASCSCVFAVLCASVAMSGTISVSGTTITAGDSTLAVMSGTAANGTSWSSYMTGTAPVAYLDLSSGSLMLDPKGVSINLVDFKWGTAGTISATTSGPFLFTTGTGNPGAVSTTSLERTLPAGTWGIVSTFQARLAATVSLVNTPTLATTGNNSASTDGSFNQPWSFGAIAPSLIGSGLTDGVFDGASSSLYSTTSGVGFRSATAGGNLLGYGNGIGMFAYTPFGGSASYGVIVPVQAVPEPSAIVLAGLGLIAAGSSYLRCRRMPA